MLTKQQQIGLALSSWRRSRKLTDAQLSKIRLFSCKNRCHGSHWAQCGSWTMDDIDVWWILVVGIGWNWQINAKFSLKHPSRMDIPAARKSRASLDQEGNSSLVGFVHLSSGESPVDLHRNVVLRIAKAFEDLPSVVADADCSPARAVDGSCLSENDRVIHSLKGENARCFNFQESH